MKKIFLFKINSTSILFLTTFLATLLISCGGTNRGSTPSDFGELNDLVESRQFEIINEWAQPQGGGNINLIGNNNFIRFEGDSVNLFLPYFGVRHAGGDYGGQGGIEYEGLAEDLVIEKQDSRILLQFKGEHSSENLRFTITLFPNGNATTSVTSSQRQVISYRGKVRERKSTES